jgi:20S proteasome subunit alpha 3
MSRRYDSKTTTFSPEGRLHQVEYAIEAINNAGSLLGISFKNGAFIAGEKRQLSKLLEPSLSKEKLFKIDDHIVVGVAGVTSDANLLIDLLRNRAQEYRLSFNEPIPVEQLALLLANLKQSYTQFGGLRPFGVACLFVGVDHHFGVQLYGTDPSGNYASWKAHSLGMNASGNEALLKEQWKENLTEQEAKEIFMKMMVKNLSADGILEICKVTKSKGVEFISDETVKEWIAEEKTKSSATAAA